MDASELTKEGVYGFGATGAHGNAGLLAVHGQPGADPRRLHRDVDLDPQLPGRNTNVYLGSAELAAICSRLGRIPTKEGTWRTSA